jgi:tryptophan synthase beta chain
MMPMYTLGHTFQPANIHAGGLRYHGAGSIVSQLYKDGLMEAVAIPQLETFSAGMMFANSEGIIPAPESCHAIAVAVREAKKAKEEGKEKTILFNLSGNGMIDLYAFEQYFSNKLQDHELPESEIRRAIDELDKIIK